MLVSIAFTLSAVIFIMWFLVVVGFIFNVRIKLPIPILCRWNIDATTSFIGFPTLSYQVYFWATYFGVIV